MLAAMTEYTAGYVTVPNALIENLGLFTAAELSLALLVFRLSPKGSPVTVTRNMWKDWTAQSVVALNRATLGLSGKCFDVADIGRWRRDENMVTYVFRPERLRLLVEKGVR